MSIVVECQCGRRFRAKDELAGKNLACPGCGAALTVPMPVAAAAPQRAAPVAPARATPAQTIYPGYPARPRNVQQERAPRFAVSGRLIVFIALLIIIPAVLFLIKIGPVKAMSQWKDAKEQVTSDITYAIEQAATRQMESQGLELKRARDVPQVRSLVIDEPVIMLRFPQSVAFQGRFQQVGNYQDFKGTYYTKDRRVVADVTVLGKTISINATMQNGGIQFAP